MALEKPVTTSTVGYSVTKDDKWGSIDGGLFVDEPYVNLLIPEDEINPAKERFLCINGNQIWLGVGVDLRVPKSVADCWNISYKETLTAKRNMSQTIEIK